MFRSGKIFRLTPVLAALLLAFPASQVGRAMAEEAGGLPNLGRPGERTATFNAHPGGATFANTFGGNRLVLTPEYSELTGLSLGGIFAFSLWEHAAGGVLLTAGANKKELLFNLGYQVDDAQRVVFTLGQLRQSADYAFNSGADKVEVTQNSGAVSYQRRLGDGLLNGVEINGYYVDTPSRDLADKTYSIDTAVLYELWNDHRRIAGGQVTGLQGRLVLAPVPSGSLKLGLGGERLEYDYLSGKRATTRGTGSAEWSQTLAGGYQIKAGADSGAAQNRFSLGLERPFGVGGRFGVGFVRSQGRDGVPDDNQVNFTWSYAFDGRRGKSAATSHATLAWGSLIDQVAKRPAFLPANAVAKIDTTATPTRLIAVDKTALPVGASVDPASGNISAVLPTPVSGIAGVTRNSAPFNNIGQFSLAGGGLVVNPKLIEQPAAGGKDTYVVTLYNATGGTTLVTVIVSRGSVKIDSITIANGDITPPVISGLAASKVSAISATFAATLNEVGIGYYVLLPAASGAPGAAQIKNGQDANGAAAALKGSVVMAPGVAANFTVAGLVPGTAYKILWFTSSIL